MLKDEFLDTQLNWEQKSLKTELKEMSNNVVQ